MLGRGAFADVYMCESRDGRQFACKVVELETLCDEEREAMQYELAVLQVVSHANVLGARGIYMGLQRTHIVMELCPNGTLIDIIATAKADGGCVAGVPHPRTREIAQQVLAGLAHLHSLAIAHRDVKPGNVLVAADGSLRICDFGYARFCPHGDEQLKDACGTVPYWSPEMATARPHGRPVDVWGVAVCLYRLACHTMPFEGTPPTLLFPYSTL